MKREMGQGMRRQAEGVLLFAVALIVTALAYATGPVWALWMWRQDRKRARR